MLKQMLYQQLTLACTIATILSWAACPLALKPANELRFACQSQADCIEGYGCVSGFCQKDLADAYVGRDVEPADLAPLDDARNGLPLGHSCETNSEPRCASGHCVDGFCCDSACQETCRRCNPATGRCQPQQAMQSCTEATLDCGEFLYGMSDNTCYRMQGMRYPGVCDSAGNCIVGDPVQRCQEQRGIVFASCSPQCLKQTSSAVCQAGVPALTLSRADICVLNAQTPSCGVRSCELDADEHLAVIPHCDAQGQCVRTIEVCGTYVCRAQQCLRTCIDDNDCAARHHCVDHSCQ